MNSSVIISLAYYSSLREKEVFIKQKFEIIRLNIKLYVEVLAAAMPSEQKLCHK
jgi:hypothetical protein